MKFTWVEFGAVLGALVLLGALAPPVKLRRVALTLLQRGAQLVGLVAVGGALVFIFWPDGAPKSLASALEPLVKQMEPALGVYAKSLAWLMAATGVCVVAAPLAIVLGFVRRLDTLSVALRRLGGMLRANSGNAEGTRRADAEPSGGRDELDEALRSVSAVVRERPKQGAKRQKLADLVQQ